MTKLQNEDCEIHLHCFGQRKLLKRTANNAKLGTSKKLKQNCAKREPKMNCPNCAAKLRYMKNTLEHAENKTIETQKGANEDETAKKR